MQQDYSINTNQPTHFEQELGPRAQFFNDEATATKIEILTMINKSVMNYYLETLLNINTETFTDKYISVLGQQAFSQLNERTTTLFKYIIYYVAIDPLFCLEKLSAFCGDETKRAEYLKEIALSPVLKLVQKLDDFDKDLINEATSDGLEPEIAYYLKAFGIL